MFDYDAVIIGGGPAGLTAALYLGRSRRNSLVLEKNTIGGNLSYIEQIENYPGFAGGISGPRLASEMINQVEKYGVNIELGEVTGMEAFSSCQYVNTANGKGYSAGVVIITGGCRRRKLGVPGEELLQGKGVFQCALCDGDRFTGKIVAVCGGGDSGLTEALHMSRLASKVILLEALPKLSAGAILRERAAAIPGIEIHTGVKVDAIAGKEKVEGIHFTENGQKVSLEVSGVLVQVGMDADTQYLQGILELDKQGYVKVNERMESSAPFILAAGDIRSGSPRQVVTAAGDGAIAAITADRLLQNL